MKTPVLFEWIIARSAALPLRALERFVADFSDCETALSDALQAERAAREALTSALDAALTHLPTGPLRTEVYNARKFFFQKNKIPAGLCRQISADPQASKELAQAIERFEQSQGAAQAASSAYRARYNAALTASCAALRQMAGDESFQRALLFASHDLLAQIPAFQAAETAAFAKKERQTAAALAQYLTRAATRTSPLSRFATVDAQRLHPKAEDLELPSFASEKAIVTPNAAILERLYEALLQRPAFYRSLRVSLNPCVAAGEQKRLRWTYFDGETEAFQETPATPALLFVRDLLLENGGQMPFPALLNALKAAGETTEAEAEGYIRQCVDTGFLQWELPEKGLRAGWSGALYQYLGFLPSDPVLSETAFLLQHLRATARILPHQSVQEARSSMADTAAMLRAYEIRHGIAAPPIAPEQVFYEDVQRQVPPVGAPEDLLQWVGALDAQVRAQTPEAPAGLWGDMIRHWDAHFSGAERVDFLRFARSFFQRETAQAQTSAAEAQAAAAAPPIKGMAAGLLIAPPYACLQTLFPPGGKLAARWLHLFPADFQSDLAEWFRTAADGLPYPWQGAHNAAFQGDFADEGLLVPGGKAVGKKSNLRLADIDLARAKDGRLCLYHRPEGRPFYLADLGLEAPETRPPLMQLLWHAGVPARSAETLARHNPWEIVSPGVRRRARREAGRLIVARAAWLIEPDIWSQWRSADAFDCFLLIREKWHALGLPARFYAQFEGPAQYFDTNSPLLIQLFGKLLKKGGGLLRISEFWPFPADARAEQSVEIAVEWRL